MSGRAGRSAISWSTRSSRVESVWLRPGGYLLASFGASDLAGWFGEWLDGVETFFSYEPSVTPGLVRAAELEIVRDELETTREPEGDATFLWVLARKSR
jgi:hypothetical protein